MWKEDGKARASLACEVNKSRRGGGKIATALFSSAKPTSAGCESANKITVFKSKMSRTNVSMG
jgi:hypothetical protein